VGSVLVAAALLVFAPDDEEPTLSVFDLPTDIAEGA